MPGFNPPTLPPSPFFQLSPRFGRRTNTSPVSPNENSRSPSLNECSEVDSRRNDIREPFLYLNIIQEVIELADRTNNLKLKVIDAFRDPNCENCNFSENGICRSHRYGSGVYNNRSNLVHPVREEPMSQILRQDIDSRRAEAREFTETLMNNLGV
tara:strand:+ start:80 stop:544 length:465 start_codon:yes stop_codon:yes gene_type:complete